MVGFYPDPHPAFEINPDPDPTSFQNRTRIRNPGHNIAGLWDYYSRVEGKGSDAHNYSERERERDGSERNKIKTGLAHKQ